MSFIDIMQSYFRGERIEALYYILPAGLLVFGLGITALMNDRGGFGWGMGVTLIAFGLVAVGTGAPLVYVRPGRLNRSHSSTSKTPL